MPEKHLQPTPLRKYCRLSEEMGVSIWVKHDDLFPEAGGGNKVRKLGHILADGLRQGCDAMVTTGSACSNHVRASALMAANLGWRAKIIIHDAPQTRLGENLLLADLAGAEIAFCERGEVARRMDEAMAELSREGRRPLYVWGGGHCLAGAKAYFEAAGELADQAQQSGCRFDYVCVASGTGTTQAGLHVGFSRFADGPKVLGFSVAHDKARGSEKVISSADELAKSLGIRSRSAGVNFDDSFLCGGYARADKNVCETIRWAARTDGLVLDPIYSGKAFAALRSQVRSGLVPQDSQICFWHTGGLLNLVSGDWPPLQKRPIS